MTSLSVPFEFITTFLVAVGAYAGAWLALSRPQFSPRGWARWAFGLGWGVLAVAETLYGAQVVNSASNTALVVLRSVAFFLLVVALGWQPPEGRAARSSQPRQPALVGGRPAGGTGSSAGDTRPAKKPEDWGLSPLELVRPDAEWTRAAEDSASGPAVGEPPAPEDQPPPEGPTRGMASFAAGTVFKAAAPAVLALGAALAALRSRLDGNRRLALALGLLGAAELFYAHGGGVANASSPVWLAAHLFELAGGLTLGWWLWRAFRVSIQARFIAALVLLLVLVIALISSTVTQVFVNSSSSQGLRSAASDAGFAAAQLSQKTRSLQASTTTLAAGVLGTLVAQQNSALLDQTVTGLQTQAPLDFMAAFAYGGQGADTLPQAKFLAISEIGPGGKLNLSPAENLILAGSEAVVTALRQGQSAQGIENIGAGEDKLAMVAASPVCVTATGTILGPNCPSSSSIVGAIAMGQLINSAALSEITLAGSAKAVLVDAKGTLLGTALPGAGPLVAPQLQAIETQVIRGGHPFQALGSKGGTTYYLAAVPIGQVPSTTTALGALLVAEPQTVASAQRTVSTTLFLGALAATLFAVGASMITGSRITRPIRELTAAAEQVRHGDLSTRVVVGEADELGLLGDAFNQMTASLGTAAFELREAAVAEARLRDQLETVLQSMTDGLVAVDRRGLVVTINREAERLLSQSAERVIGRHVEDVLVVVDSLGLSLDLPVYRLGTGSVTGFTIPNSRGSQGVPVAVTSAPILDDEGAATGAVAVLRDLVSELQVDRMKTEFLSNISHELRTPLTPIKGYADLLRRKVVPRDKLVSFLNVIVASTERMERIVDMLVDFSAMQAGRLSVRVTSFNLEQVTADLVTKWRGAAPKHSFERDGFIGLPAVAGDTRLLRRAIDELIDNAVKFSPDGGPVTLHGQMDPQRLDMVDISVTDRGIGISTEEMNRIFQDFVQVDASETRAFGGLGLGLAYVRQIIEAHNGELRVESRAGEGSRFTLIIPVWRSGVGGGGRGPASEAPVAVRPP
ncbi:MAG TPA: ATP-binding protein, partial [Actinomycetota bacterium]|nr:ATP-binding protein [Actinomycetota bacterium]